MRESTSPLKTCSICREIKPLQVFTVSRKSKDGHTSYCRECVSAANKRRYLERSHEVRQRLRVFNKKLRDEKARKVFEYLQAHPCVDCGEADPVVLEFDHRDPATKLRNVAQMIEARFSWGKIEAEIAKCDVRRANCHRRKTSRQLGHRRSLIQRDIGGG